MLTSMLTPVLLRDEGLRGGVMKHFEVLDVMVGDGHERDIHVAELVRIAFNPDGAGDRGWWEPLLDRTGRY